MKVEKATPYYYAGGRRIPLQRAPDLVAVDLNKAGSLADGLKSIPSANGVPTTLPHGIQLFDREELENASLLQGFEKSGATHPVFRSGDTLLVSLPEIRVETGSRRNQVKEFAAERNIDITENNDIQILRPISGKGNDVLTVANELVEKIGAESVSPRFLRIMPHPGVKR